MTPLQQKYQESPHGLLLVQPTGTGKTLKALELTRGTPTTVIGTASLTRNFDTEEQKFFHQVTPRTSFTYNLLARQKMLPGGQNLILDESQYLRNPSSKTYKNLFYQRDKYGKILLLSATPMYNEPADLASQVDLLTSTPNIPINKKDFYQKYFKTVQRSPGFFNRLIGVQPEVVRIPITSRIKHDIQPFVYVPNIDISKLLPKHETEVIKVPLIRQQQHLYDLIERKIPFSLRYKIRHQLLPSKKELQNLNAFLSGLRQVSNTTKPFTGVDISNKFDIILSNILKDLKEHKKSLVYSNYLDAGIVPIENRLTQEKIPYSILTGSTSKSQRAKEINNYNTNKTKVMLFSGAGIEGINLPSTDTIHLVEPHWNLSKLYQAESRGIRRTSDPNKTVITKIYLSTTLPKSTLFGKKQETSSDEYLYNLSKNKDKEIQQVLNILKESNDNY